ncbi:MAG: hypothetical protein IPG97_01055 [Microthrixaceae bacterium]|nr:hypothetical protein [Microthrixaceae bacterium]
MANRTDVSKQKRARQNKAQREALAARTKAASTPHEDRVAAATAKAPSGKNRESARAGDLHGSTAAKPTSTPARLGEVPVDIATLEGSFLRKLVQVPGGLQVIMAAVLTIVLAVMASIMDSVPPEGAEQGAKATRTLFEAYGTGAVLFLGPPLILVGNAVVFSLHPKRRRMWTMSAVMLGVFSLLLPQFLFPAGMLGYAALRSKRIEDGPGRSPFAGRFGRSKSSDGSDRPSADTAVE